MSQIIDRTGFIIDKFADYAVPSLGDYSGGSALKLAVDDDFSDISRHFDRLDLIIVPFGASADGRGFSIAMTLRMMGYEGHLRASGHILVDQFRAALRCGFDDIEISEAQAMRNPEPQWQAVPHGVSYQNHLLGE